MISTRFNPHPDGRKRLILCPEASRVRRSIEMMSLKATLPLAQRAMSLMEGEHASRKRFGTGDLIDVHAWQPGDEARMMNWAASARMGEPMVSSRERTSASQTWILLDASLNMNTATQGNETLYEVASNAACFFAALSLKRNDLVSLLIGNGETIVQLPVAHSLPDFERIVDTALLSARTNPRHMMGLLQYARQRMEHNALVVVITQDDGLTMQHMPMLRSLAAHHRIMVVHIESVNPCALQAQALLDGITMRKIPAFFTQSRLEQDIEQRRNLHYEAFNEALTDIAGTLIRVTSSQDMLRACLRMATRTTHSIGKEVH